MTTVLRKPIVDAVFAALKTALGALDQPVKLGDGQPPDPMPERFAVLYVLPSSTQAALLRAGSSDLELTLQVTSVGRSRGQCEWVADRVREAFDGLVVEADGSRVGAWATEGPSSAVPMGSGSNAVWNATEIFGAFASPA